MPRKTALEVVEARKRFSAASEEAEKALFWVCNYILHGDEAPRTTIEEWKAAAAKEDKAYAEYRKAVKALS